MREFSRRAAAAVLAVAVVSGSVPPDAAAQVVRIHASASGARVSPAQNGAAAVPLASPALTIGAPILNGSLSASAPMMAPSAAAAAPALSAQGPAAAAKADLRPSETQAAVVPAAKLTWVRRLSGLLKRKTGRLAQAPVPAVRTTSPAGALVSGMTAEADAAKLFDGLAAKTGSVEGPTVAGRTAPTRASGLRTAAATPAPMTSPRPASPPAPASVKKPFSKQPFISRYVGALWSGTFAAGLALAAAVAVWYTLAGGWALTLSFAAAAAMAAWPAAQLIRDSRRYWPAVRASGLEKPVRAVIKRDAHIPGLVFVGIVMSPVVMLIYTNLFMFRSYLSFNDHSRYYALETAAAAVILATVVHQLFRRGVRRALAEKTEIAQPFSLGRSFSSLTVLLALMSAAFALLVGPMPQRLPSVRPPVFDQQDEIDLGDAARPKSNRLGPLQATPSPSVSAPRPGDPVDAAIARGAQALIGKQTKEGSWQVGSGAAQSNWNGVHERVGITAIALEALESAGVPGSELARRAGLRFVYANMLKDRPAVLLERRTLGGNNSFPYALSYGLDTLLREYERADGPLKEKYAHAVERTLEWMAFSDLRYVSGAERMYGTFELAVTLKSLAEAKRLGFILPSHRLLGAEAGRPDILTAIAGVLENSRRPDGTFPYRAGGTEKGEENWPRTALVEYALYAAGKSDKARLEPAVQLFIDSLPDLDKVLANKDLLTHDGKVHGYAKYYYLLDMNAAARALKELDGPGVKQKAAILRDALLKLQAADGTWVDSPEASGPAYGTAMAIQTLRLLQGILARP